MYFLGHQVTFVLVQRFLLARDIQNLFLGIENVRFGNSVLDWEIFQITKNVRNVRADQSEEFGNCHY